MKMKFILLSIDFYQLIITLTSSLQIHMAIAEENTFQQGCDNMAIKLTNPINLTITDFQQDRTMFLKAEWDASPSADVDHYDFQYKKTSESAWNTKYVDESPAVVAVETLGEYDVRVRAKRADGEASAFTVEQHEVSKIDLSIFESNSNFEVDKVQISGTVSSTNGDATVTGTSTKFTREIINGDTLVFGTQEKIVSSVTDDTHLELTTTATEDNTDVNCHKTGYIALKGDVWVARDEHKIYFPDSGIWLHDQTSGLLGERVEFNRDVGDVHTQMGFSGGSSAKLFLDSHDTDSDAQSFAILKTSYASDYITLLLGISNGTDGYILRTVTIEKDVLRLPQYKLQLGDAGGVGENDKLLFFDTVTNDLVITKDSVENFVFANPAFAEGETYYRYDVLTHKGITFTFLPADKTITERYHPGTSVGKEMLLFNITEFQELGSVLRYQLTEANCLNVLPTTTIYFTYNIEGLDITDWYGTCGQPVIAGTNYVAFVDTGNVTAFRFSNGEWIVTEQGSGTTAWNVGNEDPDVASVIGNGTINATGSWGTDDIYSYNWNYGCNDSYIPAKLNGTTCADGSEITKPFVYGQNNCGVDFDEYEKTLGSYGDQTGTRSLTGGTTYSLEIDTSGTGGLKREFPENIEYWDEVNNKIDLPNHYKIFDVRYTFKFESSDINNFVCVTIQRDGGDNRVLFAHTYQVARKNVAVCCSQNVPLYTSPQTSQYGLKVYITPTGDGTISEEGIVIIRR